MAENLSPIDANPVESRMGEDIASKSLTIRFVGFFVKVRTIHIIPT